MNSKKHTVIFTDLDGTILDSNYSFKEIQPVIDQLKAFGTKLVFCSSKTRSEIEFYREKIGINDPFISENGAAVFVPKGYFNQIKKYTKQTSQYYIIELGLPYSTIRATFEEIKKECNCALTGFGDMTVQQIAKDCGLPVNLATLAKQREYSEPFKVAKDQKKKVFDMIRQKKLSYVIGGNYCHLVGNHDKSTATTLLTKMYKENLDEICTFGVGDSPNDFEMLKTVDKPFMVKDNLGATWKNILKEALSQNCP